MKKNMEIYQMVEVNMAEAIENISSQLKDIKKSIRVSKLEGKYLTADEAAIYTKYHKSYLYRYKHEIGFVQRGKNILFEKTDIDAWFKHNKKEALIKEYVT